MERAILHVYIPSFFAEAERLRRPDLAGRPVIVLRPKGSTSGIAVSVSAEAMKEGAAEGMSARHAKRACPQAVFITADCDYYRQLFEQVLDILARCSPLLEPDPPDGAYLDVTGCRKLFGSPAKIGRRIIEKVQEKTGLAPVVACAPNKLTARIASKHIIRDGKHLRGTSTRIISVCAGHEAKLVSQLPVTVLDSVTYKAAKRLWEMGISTAGQLAMIPERLLIRRFGPAGSVMKRQSLGIDASPVKAAYPAEAIIIEHMLDIQIEEPPQIEQYIARMADEAAARLRKKCALAGEAALTLFDDCPHPGVLLRQVQDAPRNRGVVASYFRFKKPTDSSASITQALSKMLYSKMQPGMQISRVRIALSDLTPGESRQLCLIGEGERKNNIGRTVDLIRERFGEGSIFFASSLAAKGRGGTLGRIAA